MKRTYSKLFALVLATVMLISLFPVSALGVRDETSAIPLGEEVAVSPAEAEAPADSGAQADLMAASGPTIPGYTQVTALRQIKANRKYLIVAQGQNGLYALYLRTSSDGAGALPTTGTYYGTRLAKLTISGDSITAAATNSNSATLDSTVELSQLLLTVAPSGSGYTFASAATTPIYLNINNTWASTTSVALSITINSNSGQVTISNTTANRNLCLAEQGGDYQYAANFGTDFWAPWNSTSGAPVYVYIQGDLPVEPGMNLPQMLSGDQIGGGDTADENPGGQNSWVFTGGRAAQGSFADVKGARTYAGHFEEYIRYTQAKQLQPSGEATTPYFQRHVINAAYEGQTLQNIVDSFETRITPLKPRAISYLVDEGGSSEANFATNLSSLITKALALQNNTGMLVIETLTAADKTAVDAVTDALPDTQKGNVLSMQFTLTAAQKTDGYPNASGHFAMAQQLTDAVAGATVSTAANWPYGAISASVMASDFPNKTSLDHAHGYTNPTTLSAAQTAIKTKMTNKTSMTWLFMGDSITHGAAWTGGYDTLAQLFEKFVKDDLERTQDIVINAGSSGATTASTISDLNRRLVKYSPDVVVLMLGTNDAGASVSETTYKANIRTILDKIIAKGATPVLRTPPPTSRSGYDIATYAQYIRDVVAESAYAGNVILVDQYGLWTDNDWSGVFSRDTLHPDEAGHLWFAHQLIKELALWNDSYKICRLEYVEMKEAGAIEIPGYTQLTDIANLDENKGYLIVSQSADGELYALYPSVEGESLGAGALVAPGNANEGARAAHLHVSGDTVTANWLKGGSDGDVLKMDNLLFTIKSNDNGYVFTAFNGRHLNMADYMFTEGTVTLTVASRGTAVPNAFSIRNVGANRVLDFTKTGDPNAYSGSSYGTDFWCPRSSNMAIYLFASDTAAIPTAKDGINDLMAEIAKLDAEVYTRASWAALQTAKTAAQAALDSGEADGDAPVYVTARDTLRDAFERLNERPVNPTVPTGATKKEWRDMVPASGTTQNQPYIAGQTGGSESTNFRIPAMITLRHQSNESKNGRIVTAIDDRWNHGGDGCSLDTLVSYSDNNGSTWNYQLANYFGDSTNAKETLSAAFIDPVLVEDLNGTIYMMVDVWPGGIDLNTAGTKPSVSSGYVEIGGKKCLALYVATPNSGSQTNTNYDYYVGDFEGGYAPVYEPIPNDDDAFSGYYVDEYYYLYYNSATTFAAITNKGTDNDKIWCARRGENNVYVQQNIFFQNATLHVRSTSFLWVTKSTDGGETWGSPQMINGQVRTGEHRFYGVGPGCGLCVETNGEDGAIPNGTVMFPVYVNANERAGFIYSTDNGATWHRGNDATTDQSSESCLVQIDATTIRHFYRDGVSKLRYTDHTWNGNGWTTGSPVTTTATKTTGCQLSAIKYSKQVDGKDAIIVSTAASGGSGRNTGKLYTFLVNNDANHTLELYNTYSVNGTAYYCYSSLSETADGDIALLYEHAGTAVTFKIIPITDLIPALTVTGFTGNYNGTARTVAVKAEPDTATLQYSTDGGTTWSDTKPTFINAGTYTVTVKATWGSVVQEASATVTINKVTPTLVITSDKESYDASEIAQFTISGVPGEGTVTLQCSNTEEGHDRNISLVKQSDGTYTGSHDVKGGRQTFTATYAATANYNAATATRSITVAPAEFGLSAQDYTGTYNGQPHSITVTAAEGVTLTYCATEDGEYTETKPEYTNAGTYTTWFKAVKGTEEVTGSANVTIAKATPTLAILCGHEDHGETHSISTTDLPLVLTITGVPAEDQGKFTLTTFNDAVRNLTRNEDGTWTAAPNIPPITRTYHFIATFDPTQDQDGNEIENPNYEHATDEFTVTISRPADEVINFNFNFADGVEIDPEISTQGTFEVLYDGLAHGILPALTYDSDLVLTYHVSEEDAEIGSESWSDEEPTFKQPGTYTVSVMASPTTSPVAKVLTVVLNIVERETPTSITITPSAEELEGGDKLILTVEGAPEAGILTVTCVPSLRVTETERGKYSVTLPNTTQSYTITAEFEGAGSYQPSHASCTVSVTAKPSTSNPAVPVISTETKDDGSTTTVETKPDGTKVETTEKPDGTKEIVETKADGTVTESVEKPDGTKEAVETKPDGTVTESVEKPDGTKEAVETKPDGTVTETKIDAEGAKVEKVTDPEENVTITATDAEGETVAEVKVPAVIPESEKRFEDVPVGHWADEAIHKLAAIEVVNGVTDTQYSPVVPMKRGDLAVVLHRLSNGKKGLTDTFADVESGKYYADGIAWAAKVGVVEGYSDTEFRPEAVITREQLALMLMRYAKLLGVDTSADAEALNAFADGGKTSSWAVDGVAWCVKAGIIQGMDATTLSPNTNVSRAQVAVMLQRFIDLVK